LAGNRGAAATPLTGGQETHPTAPTATPSGPTLRPPARSACRLRPARAGC